MVNTNKSKQNWTVGNMVKVGFMSLEVVSMKAEKDYLPDIYLLKNPKNNKHYEFIPHNGLNSINDKQLNNWKINVDNA